MVRTKIEKVIGRQVLDSRGNPTVEAEVYLSCGVCGRGIAPSGASTGQFEAHELRDDNSLIYNGKSVKKAVRNINTIINDILVGFDAADIYTIDRAMIDNDGTTNKSCLGANAILAVSIACANAASNAMNLPLYKFIGGISGTVLPIPMMNIINGGAHAKNSLDFQEFMIMPVKAASFKEALRKGTEVYHSLKKVLEGRELSTAVGDEGGFAPDVNSVNETMDLLMEAVKNAGYTPGEDICFALDVAASEWKSEKGKGFYRQPKLNKEYQTDELIDLYTNLINTYPIISIEDPLDEEDWDGWEKITQRIGNKVQLVGDDLFVTNTQRLQKGIDRHCGNSILIKPNQIGSLSETIDAIKLAHKNGFTAIASHRSGETEDTTIADLSVGMYTGMIKTGAPCRSERVAKYNRLIRIEEELGAHARFYGEVK